MESKLLYTFLSVIFEYCIVRNKHFNLSKDIYGIFTIPKLNFHLA